MFLRQLPFPEINAGLNGIATLLLTAGFIFILKGDRGKHRICMLSAFGVSILFLATYVSSKVINRGMHTPFAGEGIWRTLYYTLLITHIITAMVILPLIFRTLFLALKGRVEDHRSWARWTFPLWYYVSVSGVLVYFFLYQWFSL